MNVKVKTKPKQRIGLTDMAKQAGPKTQPGVPKSADALSKLSESMGGPSSMQTDPLAELADGILGSPDRAENAQHETGNITGLSDPVKYTMGHQAPSMTELQEFSEGMVKEALDKYDSAPKTKESKAFLDGARELTNEIGQLGALLSLAKFSNNYQWVGMHLAGQVLEVVMKLAQMSEGMLDKSNSLKHTSMDMRTRLYAGRLNFYGRSAPFAQKAGAGLV